MGMAAISLDRGQENEMIRLPLSQTIAFRDFRLIADAESVQLIALALGEVQVNGQAENARALRDGDRIDCKGQSYLMQKQQGHWSILDLEHDMPGNQGGTSHAHTSAEPILALLENLLDLRKRPGRTEMLDGILRTAMALLDSDAGVLQAEELRFQFPGGELPLSTSAIAQALEKREVVLWNQASADASVEISMSIITNRLSSILVAPLGPNSYLYLQRQARTQPFGTVDCDIFSKLVHLAKEILADREAIQSLSDENLALRGIQDRYGLIYSCEAMQKAVALAEKVSSAPVPVIIHGETGSGKEVFARFIHRNGPRASKPFVAVNCGAIPSSLIESILFGHVKGAFTGAVEHRKGLFEEADGGTLFLDEIAEIPLDMQVKLLRVLQERKVTRVGDAKEIAVDVRILAASHRNLEARIQENLFREDLYFRISVMQINLPPLRDRGQDIIVLARRFLDRYAAEFGLGRVAFSKAAEKVLLRHDWPGNVRELENRVQKALVQRDSGAVEPADLGLDGEQAGSRGLRTLASAREAAERECVDRALRDAQGNLTLAGQMLGIDRKVLREIMERLGIDKSNYKENSAE